MKTTSLRVGEGDEVLDERGVIVGALAEADGGPSGESEPMGWWRSRDGRLRTPAMWLVATAPIPGFMIPSFPVAGLMLAAACVAASGVDMLGSTLS